LLPVMLTHNARKQQSVMISANPTFSSLCRRSVLREGLTAAKGRQAQAMAADTLPVVAEHRLPHGVTSLCPPAAMGLPISAGTRKGDVFQLMLTKQVQHWSLPPPPSIGATQRPSGISAHIPLGACSTTAGMGSMNGHALAARTYCAA
jgi:hypothetical protein